MKMRSAQPFMNLAILGAMALATGGCASKMTKAECQKTDFYQMGLSDGRDGESTARQSKVTDEC